MLESASVRDNPRSTILSSLEDVERLVRNAIQQTVAIVQPRRGSSVDEHLACVDVKEASDLPEVEERVVDAGMDRLDVLV